MKKFIIKHKEKIRNPWVILAFIVLCVGGGLLSYNLFIKSSNADEGVVYYVDPTGTDDVSHGTTTGDSAFKTIQYAINDSRVVAGDTIDVAAGTYVLTSRISVNKSVSIIGDVTTPSNVIINAPVAGGTQHGQNSVFVVTSSDVTISGLRIQGALHTTGAAQNAGIYVDDPRSLTLPGLNNITISDNEITNNGYGVVVQNIRSSTISNNKIYSNKKVAGKESESGVGIVVYGDATGASATNNLTINGNDVYDNETEGIRIGVGSDTGPDYIAVNLNTTISNNTVHNNGSIIGGVDKYIGIKSSGFSTGVTVSGNQIYNHTGTTISATSGNAGIQIHDSKNWSIVDNNIHDNLNGIIFANSGAYGADSGSHTITGNTITNNVRGISIDKGTEAVANNNSIYANSISTFSAVPFLPYNTYNSGSGTFDVTNNWWGNAVKATVQSKISGDTIFTPYYVDAEKTVLSNTQKSITAFTIPTQVGVTVINESAHTIAVTLPADTAVDALVPTITINGSSSVSPASSVAHDFTTPQAYTVTTPDGSASQGYVVTVTDLDDDEGVPDNDGDADISTTKPNLIISNSTQAVAIAVASGVTHPAIDLSSLVTNGTGVLPAISISAANVGGVHVTIPASTTVTSVGTTWDGVLAAPTAATLTLPVTAGQTKTLSTAVEIGSTDTKLSFNKGIRLAFPGEAGKKIGFAEPGASFIEITAVCDEDATEIDNDNDEDKDCKLNVGSDLVVWINHFTTFATYTETPIPTSVSSGGGYYPISKPIVVKPIIPITSSILGCENRTNGYSTINGQSCIKNIVLNTNPSPSLLTTPSSNSVSSTYNLGTKILKNGSTGDAVIELQRFLNDTLKLGLVLDGKLGPKTIAVIKQWQKNNGLVPDGLVGPKTKAMMK